MQYKKAKDRMRSNTLLGDRSFMKRYILASKLDTHGSAFSALGKGIIVTGRVFLCLTFVLLVIYVLFFAEVGGASGVPFGFGIVGWLFLEIVGSIIFHIGQIGKKSEN